jgi:hypothetical protein
LKLSFGVLILEELLTITFETFFCFVDIGRIIDHHCKNKKVLTVMVNNSSNINKPKKKVSTVMVNNSTNINKPKESFNSDGQ